MASKGAYVAGTDGGDYSHRERVAPHYKDVSAYKVKTHALAPYQLAFHLAAAAAFVYMYVTTGMFVYHRPFLATAATPLLLRYMDSNRVALLAYSGLCGLIAAYLIWLGIGRTLDLMALMEGRMHEAVIFLVLNTAGAVVHLLAMYYTRRILYLYSSIDDAARARRSAARPKAE
eukprot:m.143316 g.143316  ORF g.143316 m.143316 type:complete len:174 (+) comp16737_c2_seq1:191-712(+)